MLLAALPAERVKLMIERTLHLDRDAIHVYFGVIVFIAASRWFAGRWTAKRLLLPVIIAALLLELGDLITTFATEGLLYGFSLKDILNTSAVPVLFWLAFMRGSRKADVQLDSKDDHA